MQPSTAAAAALIKDLKDEGDSLSEQVGLTLFWSEGRRHCVRLCCWSALFSQAGTLPRLFAHLAAARQVIPRGAQVHCSPLQAQGGAVGYMPSTGVRHKLGAVCDKRSVCA